MPIFLLSCLLLRCSPNSKSKRSKSPYQNSAIVPIKIERYPDNYLLPLNSFEERVKIPKILLQNNRFCLLKYKPKTYLFYTNVNGLDKLYSISNIHDSLSIKLIAEPGRGPGEIQNGIRLLKTNNKLYLIQRHRVSIIENKPLRLEVKRTYSTYLTFYSSLENEGALIINTYPKNNNSTFQKVTPNFKKTIKYIGGYLETGNHDLNTQLNLNFVTSNTQGTIYIQLFMRLPYIGVYNSSLELIKVFHFQDFKMATQKKNKFNPKVTTIDDTKRHTLGWGVFPTKKNTFWIIFKDSFYKSAKDYKWEDRSKEEVVTYYYYKLDPTLNITYLGKSKYYALPFMNRYIFSMNDSLFITKQITSIH